MEPIFTFSKQIKSTKVNKKKIEDKSDIKKLDAVIQNLEDLPSITESRLEDIGLRTNPRKWIRVLLKSFPEEVKEDVMENLLFNFTDSMQTRMREKSKHALGLLLRNELILCHSKYGQQTITPEWKIIPRMLDTDNILRFVSFFIRDGDINVKYWERSSTSSFIEWLGLPRKQAFLIGGKYRITTEIDQTSLEFQLTEDEMQTWLENHPEFRDGEIRFPNPIKVLEINKIKVGSNHYDNTQDFIQDYKAEQHGLPLYQREYENIKEDNLPLLMTYYDEEIQVIRVEGDEEDLVISKDTPNFHIIFADGDIKLRASYRQKIANSLLNKEVLRICHVGIKFNAESTDIGNLKIFNNLRTNALTKQIIGYYNEVNLQDVDLDTFFQYVAIKTLALSNRNLPIEYFLNELADEIISKVQFRGKLTKSEDDVIEYKSREILSGGNGNAIDYLSEDLKKKLKDNPCKFYIIGVEDNGHFDPIPNSRINSDRIDVIRKGIQETHPDIQIYTFHVEQQNDSLLFILAF